MPLLMFDSKHQQKQYAGNNKMLMPSYFDFNLGGGSQKISSSKVPFIRDYKLKQRDKYNAAFNHLSPPLATQQAIAMMEYELGNNLILSNSSNGHYKPKIVNAVDKNR